MSEHLGYTNNQPVIDTPKKSKRFQQDIFDYYNNHGCYDLLWRLTSDLWELLLAEVLLYKTISAQTDEVFPQIQYYRLEKGVFYEIFVLCNNTREFNCKILDLGAAVCTERDTKCMWCHLREICNYYNNQVGRAAESLWIIKSTL